MRDYEEEKDTIVKMRSASNHMERNQGTKS